MKVYDIGILTVKEYKKHKNIIPEVDESWWLKSNKKSYSAPAVSCILDYGVCDSIMVETERYVRPVMHIDTVEQNIGEHTEVFGESWTVLSKDSSQAYVLCDRCVAMLKYGKGMVDYDNSNIKKYLEKWLIKRQKTSDKTTHKKYIKKENAIKEYLSNSFSRYWVGPISLMIPCIALLLWGSSEIEGYFTIPSLLVWFSQGIAMICAIIGMLQTLFVVGSAHNDTGLRHAFNTLLLSATIITFWNTTSWINFSILMSILAFFCINKRYLSEIKYYS